MARQKIRTAKQWFLHEIGAFTAQLMEQIKCVLCVTELVLFRCKISI